MPLLIISIPSTVAAAINDVSASILASGLPCPTSQFHQRDHSINRDSVATNKCNRKSNSSPLIFKLIVAF